jgi:hypothetical protein
MQSMTFRFLSACAAFLIAAPAAGSTEATLAELAPRLKVGDVVFIRVPVKPFREVSAATGSWTNHVGVVVEVDGPEPQVAESTFPFARSGGLAAFAARSEGGRLAVTRLDAELTPHQHALLREAVRGRLGTFYDTGFDLHSKRQFCSRFVREVLLESTGTAVGEVETFANLLSRRPDANLGFWKLWYLGRIPWQRETVTPASVLESPALHTVFDGALR